VRARHETRPPSRARLSPPEERCVSTALATGQPCWDRRGRRRLLVVPLGGGGARPGHRAYLVTSDRPRDRELGEDELERLQLATMVAGSLRRALLRVQEGRLQAQVARDAALEAGWGAPLFRCGPTSMRLLDRARRAGGTGLPVVLVGEPGTGRESLALVVHRHSPRAQHPFVTVPCHEAPESVAQILFSPEGALASATGGTLYLENLQELGADLQARLAEELPRELTVVASLHRPLAEVRQQGRVVAPLAETIGGIEILIPPLRERPEEVAPLAVSFLQQAAPEGNLRLASSTLPVLESYAWPGNVKELQACMEQVLLDLRGNLIRPGHLPRRVRGEDPGPPEQGEAFLTLEQVEARQIRRALAETRGNVAAAARLLDIPRARLYRLLRRHRIAVRRSSHTLHAHGGVRDRRQASR
jgi:DNA-binding NtrC family response regulator